MFGILRKGLGAAFAVSLVAVPTSRWATAATKHSGTSYAGTWQYSATVACSDRTNSTTSLVCAFKIGNQMTGTAAATMKSDAKGNFTFSATYVTSEATPKAKPLCGKTIMTAKYNGSCYITSTGKGTIAAGLEGAHDFKITSETATYHTFPLATVVKNPLGKSAYPYDTEVPATVGVYDAHALLVMAGLIKKTDKAPPGLYINMQVDHSAT